MRRLAGHAAAAVGGALVGALLVLAADGLTRPTGPSPDSPPATEAPAAERMAADGRPRGIVLAWAPGGLPDGVEARVERIKGVGSATLVKAGLDWIRSSRLPDGTRLDPSPGDSMVPFEVGVVDPQEYAAFVPPSERDAILSLGRGQVLLARTSAELRGGSSGLKLRLTRGPVTVAGVVSDVAANGYEAIMRGPAPAAWARVDEFLLIHNRNARRELVERVIRSGLEPGQRLRVRMDDEQPFLRYGDAVHPQMIIKREFGEFAGRPLADGRIAIDRRWVRQNIRRAAVPILGEVTCHRALFPQLRRALRSLQGEGLEHLITGYAGCYSPRFISSIPTGRLSHHAWGIAFDINNSDNPFGAEPNLSPKVVDVIEEWGFTWGGRWLIPDGMHFEWQSWP